MIKRKEVKIQAPNSSLPQEGRQRETGPLEGRSGRGQGNLEFSLYSSDFHTAYSYEAGQLEA